MSKLSKLTKQQVDQIKPTLITTTADIKRAVTPFMPHQESNRTLTTQFQSVSNDGKTSEITLTAPMTGDARSQLMEGLKPIKARIDIIEKFRADGRESAVKGMLLINTTSWVDGFIAKRLGGVREGYRIKWDISEGVFYFDPFTGKLTRCERVST